MSRLILRRQITQSVPETAGTWFSDAFVDTQLAWANAQKCFPEFFRGDLGLSVQFVNEGLFKDIKRHTGELPNCDHYRTDEYVGVAIRHMIPGKPVNDGDKLFTSTSYDSGGIAMYEICVMTMESIRTIVRHLLYTMETETTPFDYNYEEAVDCILTTGTFLILPHDYDNVRARESSPRPVR